MSSLWQRILHKLGMDYEDLPQHQQSEAYSYNAPLPTCSIPGGCPEEMYCKGKYVYPYCKHHYEMRQSGVNVTAVCDHPACMTDILDSSKTRCIKHSQS